MPSIPVEPPSIGAMLREWRKHRGLSQEELSFEANLSARHISFLETGRSLPSRRSLGALADALGIPHRERNELFEAAGFARPYSDASLSDSALAFHHQLVRSVLARHEPWFAVAIDRHWNIRMTNNAADQFLAQFFRAGAIDPPLEPNLARLLFHPAGLSSCLLNWHDVCPVFMERLEREVIRNPLDTGLAALRDEMASYQTVPKRAPSRQTADDHALVLHLSMGDLEARLIGTIMAFDSARSPALEELRIETFFPADEETRRQMEAGQAS